MLLTVALLVLVADEIEFCAAVPPNPDRQRLRYIVGVTLVYDDWAEKKTAPGVKAAIQTEQADLRPGVTSNRLMVRLKMKFCRAIQSPLAQAQP